MKLYTSIITAMVAILLFTQCKKKSAPVPPPVNGDTLSFGTPYIIRTKYLCPDGRAFALRSISNYEALQWEPVTKEQLRSIKEDDSNGSNPYVWKFGSAITHGGTIGPLPSELTFPGAIRVFSMYQQGTDGVKRYLAPPSASTNHEDNTGLGLGPSYSAMLTVFTEEDLKVIEIATTRFHATDSTVRLMGYGQPFWWYLSLPTDPDDICEDYNSRVIWRNSFACPNSTSIGNVWKADFCAVSQLVLEKID